MNWALVVVVPESDFTAQINVNQRNLLWLCLIPLGVSVVVAVLLARRFSEPLLQLAAASESLANAREERWDKIFGVIDQVRDRDAALATALSDTVNNFQYMQILDTLQTISAK
ncbi:MAG: hypothetical protein AAGN15_02660 [Cyanobacteria bacterium J06581_3]